MNLNLAELEQVFFAAMRSGYTVDAPKTSVPGMPGSKVIEFRQGIYTVKDMYYVGPDMLHSFGQTIIWQDDIPVWHMQYMGQYKDEAIPFLKQALNANYEEGVFRGGRGPKLYVANTEGFKYHNITDTYGFEYFLGNEEIYKNGKWLGSHRYQGSILFEKPNSG